MRGSRAGSGVLALVVILSIHAASAWAMALIELRPSDVQVSSTSQEFDADAWSDRSVTTGWRPASDDVAPWVEFRFDVPVQPGFLVFESLAAEGVGIVRELTVTADTGVTEVLRLPDYAEIPALNWKSVGGVRSLRIAVTGCESGSVGLGELAVAGRRAPDPEALTLGRLGLGTLVLERDLQLPANRPATLPVTGNLFIQRDGFFPWSMQMRARDVSTSDRTVRAGKSFEIDAVMQTAEALVFRCTDGSTFGLFEEINGMPRSLMSITEQLTVDELNDVFEGVFHLSDPRARANEDY